MNSYNIIKDYNISLIKQNKVLGLCSIGYACICDYVICNRFNYNYSNVNIDENKLKILKENDKLFINGSNIDNNIFSIIINIFDKHKIANIIMLIANIEPYLDANILTKLVTYSKYIFIVNNNIIHEKIFNLPIGFRDPCEVVPNHIQYSHSFLINEKNIKREKEYLCFMSYSIGSEHERIDCSKILENKSFVFNINNLKFPKQPQVHCGAIPVGINYEYTHKSKYVLCPRGAGIETHRFYEALYLDSIPIVKKMNNPTDKLYNIFPCIVVDNWTDVTEDLLNKKYDKLYNDIIIFNNNHWYNDINCLLDILKERG